jgi:hypothetical protein
MLKSAWKFLGDVFRVKTIGDILGWWDTASWQRGLSLGFSLLTTVISGYLHAPVWILPFVALVGFAILIKAFSATRRESDPLPAPPTDPLTPQHTKSESHGHQSPTAGGDMTIHGGIHFNNPRLPISGAKSSQAKVANPAKPLLLVEGFGSKRVVQNYGFQTLAVSNIQKSTNRSATRVRARMEFKHPTAKVVIIEAAYWAASPFTAPSVNIPPGDRANLIYLVDDNVNNSWKFPDPPSGGDSLESGEWRVLVTIDSDNCDQIREVISFILCLDKRLGYQKLLGSDLSGYTDWLKDESGTA